MVSAYLVQTAVSALFLTLTLRGVNSAWPFYIVLLLLGAGRALGWPARQSFLPLLVPQGRFAQAISWNSAAFQTATILGPALGGVLYLLGPAVVYAVCSATMFAMAARRWRYAPAGGSAARPPDRRDSSA